MAAADLWGTTRVHTPGYVMSPRSGLQNGICSREFPHVRMAIFSRFALRLAESDLGRPRQPGFFQFPATVLTLWWIV